MGRGQQHPDEALGRGLVELGGRLVEHHEAGTDAEGAGDGDPLALPAGEQPHRPVPQRVQVERLQPFEVAVRVRREPPNRPRDLEVRDGVGGLGQVHGLPHHRGVLPPGPRQPRPVQRGEVDAAELDAPGVRTLEPDEHPQQRALARSGAAADDGERGGGHVEVEAGQHDAVAERLRDALEAGDRPGRGDGRRGRDVRRGFLAPQPPARPGRASPRPPSRPHGPPRSAAGPAPAGAASRGRRRRAAPRRPAARSR